MLPSGSCRAPSLGAQNCSVPQTTSQMPAPGVARNASMPAPKSSVLSKRAKPRPNAAETFCQLGSPTPDAGSMPTKRASKRFDCVMRMDW